MPESWQQGAWLLIDAAGPMLHTGLLRDGVWHVPARSTSGFIESLRPAVDSLLQESGYPLRELSGVIVAVGPGSTLGLRLSAMYTSSLLTLPRLQHWECWQYNNLAAACLAANPNGGRMAAPWKRDSLHLAEATGNPASPVELTTCDPETVIEDGIPCVILGNRRATVPAGLKTLDNPVNQLPGVFQKAPALLQKSPTPQLYTPTTIAFARWSAERHRGE